MKKVSLLAVIMLMAFPALSLAADATYQGQIFDMMCAKMGNHDAGYTMTGTKTPKACTLACNKGGSPLVLYNKATNTIYKLDNQSEAKTFAGQDVKVRGTLDKSTNTIRVEAMTKMK